MTCYFVGVLCCGWFWCWCWFGCVWCGRVVCCVWLALCVVCGCFVLFQLFSVGDLCCCCGVFPDLFYLLQFCFVCVGVDRSCLLCLIRVVCFVVLCLCCCWYAVWLCWCGEYSAWCV